MSLRKSVVLFFSQAVRHRVPAFLLLILPLVLILARPTAAEAAKYASMVVDADTGDILHSVNPDMRAYPASLTKMMTLYLLFDALDSGRVHLTDTMPVSAHAAAQSPTKLGLRRGQTLEVEDAILGLCTKSANDAAVTVAEYLGGSESAFAEMMTRKAAALGMNGTRFRNASGLPNSDQFTTARDMVTLAHALIYNHAHYYHYFSTQTFVYKGETIHNHNHLMEWYGGMDGIKTGFIGASGFNLVASARRGGHRLIGVVFGGTSAPSRDRHMAGLLDAAFARTSGAAGVNLASYPEPLDSSASKSGNSDVHAVMKTMAMTKAAHSASAKTAKPATKTKKTAKAARRAEESVAQSDDWGIQVGAFSRQQSARAAAQAAMKKLGRLVSDGDVEAPRIRDHASTIYRARVTGLSERAAREACRRLARAHASCSVINTGTHLASR